MNANIRDAESCSSGSKGRPHAASSMYDDHELMDPKVAGKPVVQQKKKSTFARVAIFIIIMEVCERLTYYGLSVNMVVYLWTYLGYSKSESTALKMAFTGVAYTAPLIGSIMADAFFGRFKVIKYVGMFYTLGVIVITIATLPFYNEVTLYPDTPNPVALGLYFLGIFMVALGTGGIKSCVSTLGADQFDENDPQDKKEKDAFFTWFMVSVQVGGLVGGYFPELMEGVPNGFPIGYGITAGLMICAMVVFLLGSKRYKKPPPAGSEILEAGKTFGSAIARKICPCTVSSSSTAAAADFPGDGDVKQREDDDGDDDDENDEADESNWMLIASRERGGPFSKRAARNAYQVWRLLPLWSTQIGFCLVYLQTNETFIVQGVQMDDRVYKASTLAGTADPILCIFTMLGVEYILAPLMKRVGWELTPIRKLGLSIVTGIITCVYMGAIEYVRRSSPIIQEYRDGLYAPMHELSVFAQLPGYFFACLGQAFAWVGSLQYFYDEGPEQYRAITASFSTLATAAASYLGMVLVLILQAATADNPWIADNADEGHLDWYFFLCAGLNVLNLLWFFVAYRLYAKTGGMYNEIKRRRDERKEKRRKAQV